MALARPSGVLVDRSLGFVVIRMLRTQPRNRTRRPAMFRFLYLADDAATLRDRALPLARIVAAQGWTAHAMARGATGCDACLGTLARVFEPFWTANPLDPRNLLAAAGRVRAFVEREEYDVVHLVSPSRGFLAWYALRPLLALPFPQVVHSPGAGPALPLGSVTLGGTDLLAAPGHGGSSWDVIYARVLGLPEQTIASRPIPRRRDADHLAPSPFRDGLAPRPRTLAATR